MNVHRLQHCSRALHCGESLLPERKEKTRKEKKRKEKKRKEKKRKEKKSLRFSAIITGASRCGGLEPCCLHAMQSPTHDSPFPGV